MDSYFGDLGCEIDLRPVHLATLKEPSAGKGPEPGPRKKTWYASDLRDWAELCGAELSPDPGKLRRSDTQLALRAALVAKDAGRLREFMQAAFRARWAEATDLSDAAVVRRLLADAALDVDPVFERAQSDELAQRLADETRSAIELGVFGVPTLIVGDRPLWGNDRFELARYFVEKKLRARPQSGKLREAESTVAAS